MWECDYLVVLSERSRHSLLRAGWFQPCLGMHVKEDQREEGKMETVVCELGGGVGCVCDAFLSQNVL